MDVETIRLLPQVGARTASLFDAYKLMLVLNALTTERDS